MNGLSSLGRTLLALGAILAAAGLVLILVGRFPGLRVGRLPGDLRIERGNFTFYFPLATSIVVSIVLSLAFWLFGRR